MQALFTGGLGDFIGAESFMSDKEKDAVTTVLWATRNREEIKAAGDLKTIFPNMIEEKIMFDDFCDERPTRDWQPGDRFMNIGRKHELNLKCGLNLSQEELDAISDHSLDATLEGIFSKQRKFQSSRIATTIEWPDVGHYNLPAQYIVIHPWSDAEINGREFNEHDWPSIFKFLENANLKGVVIPYVVPNAIHVYHQYTIRILGHARDAFAAEMTKRGVGNGVYYPIPVHELNSFGLNLDLPETTRASKEVLSIPVHPSLSQGELETIVSVVNSIANAGA